jgi:hypothetical protein
MSSTTASPAETPLEPSTLSLANADRLEVLARERMKSKLFCLALRQWEKVLYIRLSLQGYDHSQTMSIFEEIGTCYYKMGSQTLAIGIWHIYIRSSNIPAKVQPAKRFREALTARCAWTADDWKHYDRNTPISLSHERSGDEHRQLGDYIRAKNEYHMATQVEMTFKFSLGGNPVVAHLRRKIACLGLDKATAVARQHRSVEHDNHHVDWTKSNSWNKEWLQDSSINGLLDAGVCQAIALGDEKFVRLQWHDATIAYFTAIQIGNDKKPLRSDHDHAPSGTVGAVLPSVLWSDTTRATQFGNETAPIRNDHDHAPSSATGAVPSILLSETQNGNDPSPWFQRR